MVVSSVPASSTSPVGGLRRRRGWRPLLAYLPTVWFLVTLNFALPRTMPGDPIAALVGNGGSGRELTAQEREAALRYYALDRPVAGQYLHYMGRLARGDLGVSIRHHRPVASLVADRLPWTLLLAISTVVLGAVVGTVGGVFAGWRRGRAADHALLGMFIAVGVLPSFLLASLAAFVFSAKLGWFPLSGATTPFDGPSGLLATTTDIAWHLVLPATTGAVLYMAINFLTMRAGMVSELGADYLLLGRAKGLRPRRLEYRYAARNALLPVVSVTALSLGVAASSGIIFVETVFAYPGMGQLLFESANFRDYPALQGCFLVVTLGVVSVNFLADVLSTKLDPRIRT